MYKVKALSVGLPGNVIKHSGDTINEGQIKPELAERLVKQGFLEKLPVFEEKVEIGTPEKIEAPIERVKKVPKLKKAIEPLNDELID